MTALNDYPDGHQRFYFVRANAQLYDPQKNNIKLKTINRNRVVIGKRQGRHNGN